MRRQRKIVTAPYPSGNQMAADEARNKDDRGVEPCHPDKTQGQWRHYQFPIRDGHP